MVANSKLRKTRKLKGAGRTMTRSQEQYFTNVYNLQSALEKDDDDIGPFKTAYLAATGIDLDESNLAKGKYGDFADKHGKTLLMTAAEHSTVKIFEYLLKKGANPKKMDNDGNSVYTYIIKYSENGNEKEAIEKIKKLVNFKDKEEEEEENERHQ